MKETTRKRAILETKNRNLQIVVTEDIYDKLMEISESERASKGEIARMAIKLFYEVWGTLKSGGQATLTSEKDGKTYVDNIKVQF